MVEYPQFDDKFIMILVITGNKTLMQPITSVVGIGSSKHDFMGCGLNKFSDIRLAEYIKLLNRQYITNALIGNAERRGRNHVVEFGLYGVNLLNKELAKFVSKIALQNFLTTLAINKDMEKLSPQLYQVKMKICYDQGCNDIGVVIATK